jgi:hypothetical protein
VLASEDVCRSSRRQLSALQPPPRAWASKGLAFAMRMSKAK